MWERVPLPATTRRANRILRDIERCLTPSLARGTLPRNQLELVPRLSAQREARVASLRVAWRVGDEKWLLGESSPRLQKACCEAMARLEP